MKSRLWGSRLPQKEQETPITLREPRPQPTRAWCLLQDFQAPYLRVLRVEEFREGEHGWFLTVGTRLLCRLQVSFPRFLSSISIFLRVTILLGSKVKAF